MLRKKILWFALISLFFCCNGKKEQGADLYEMRVFLMKGSNQTSAETGPLFPDETSVQFIENVLDNAIDLKAQLRRTFGYRQVELEDVGAFPFMKAKKKQTLILKMQSGYYLRIILFPDGNQEIIPLSVSVNRGLDESGIPARGQYEYILNLFSDTLQAEKLFSLRADVPLKKGVILGRALKAEQPVALFVVLQPREFRIETPQELGSLAEKYPDLREIYGRAALKDFIIKITKKMGIYQTSSRSIWKNNTGADTSIVPFAEMNPKPKVLKKAAPDYPEAARRKKLEGMTVVNLLVNKKGAVESAALVKSSGDAGLDSAAVAAAYQFEFRPGMKNGKPVKFMVKLPFLFRLKN